MYEDITARLQRLEHIESARALQVAYADAVDDQAIERLADVFAPDAVLTAPGRRFEGFDAIADFYRDTYAADPSGRRHFVTNVAVDHADGEVVVLRSRFVYTAGTRGESVLGWGRYTDRFGLVDGALRMTSKDIVVEHRGPVGATWGTAADADAT